MLRRVSLVLLGATFLLVFSAVSSSAQNQYERQVREYLANAGDALVDRGFRETGDVYTGSLDDSEEESVWITLRGGSRYSILGVCDNDCSDIDLYVYDEDGDQIDSDVSTDDVPILEVNATRTADYRVRVKMFSCSTEPCYYGFSVYRRGGRGGRNDRGSRQTVSDRGGSGPQAQVRRAVRNAFLDNLADRGFEETRDSFDGSLDDDEEDSIWITLNRGMSYAILGGCDNDCGDMDLFLYDEDGDEVDSDVSTDAIPIVEVNPRRTADYRIRVRMYNCSVEPCYYAVEVYSR